MLIQAEGPTGCLFMWSTWHECSVFYVLHSIKLFKLFSKHRAGRALLTKPL